MIFHDLPADEFSIDSLAYSNYMRFVYDRGHTLHWEETDEVEQPADADERIQRYFILISQVPHDSRQRPDVLPTLTTSSSPPANPCLASGLPPARASSG